MPTSAQMCLASWRKYLPCYEIKEWNEDNFDVNAISYTREAYKLKKYAFVSDYVRFWVIYNYGGLYFDTDVEIVRNMEVIIDRGAFMGMEKNLSSRVNMIVSDVNPGIGIGAPAHLPIYKEVLDYYESHHFTTWSGVITDTVVTIISSILSKKEFRYVDGGIMMIDDIYIYPTEYFCPKNYFTGELNITSDTVSIHHYSASWITPHRSLWRKIKKRISYIMVRAGICK